MDNVSIESGDYEFENLEELLNSKIPFRKTIKFIGKKGAWPQLLVSIHESMVYINLQKDEPLLLGSVEKIKTIIKRNKRALVPSIYNNMVLIAIGLILCLTGLITRQFSLIPEPYPMILVYLSYPPLFYSLLFSFPSRNRIFFTYSKDTLSFWERNKDKLIVAIIPSILSLIVGYFLGKL